MTCFFRARQWAIACEQFALYESKRAIGVSLHDSIYRICSRHFEDNCYAGPSKRRLTSAAIPTLCLKNEGLPLEDDEEHLEELRIPGKLGISI